MRDFLSLEDDSGVFWLDTLSFLSFISGLGDVFTTQYFASLGTKIDTAVVMKQMLIN
jgi:hypothetical protein